MTVAAVMMVRDEADIVGHTIDHLMGQIDVLYVSDNGSTDGTTEILQEAVEYHGFARIVVLDDPDLGYYQSAKTTALARIAHADGHEWVVPCDADEIWVSPDGRTVGEALEEKGINVQIVKATLFDHIPTAMDDPTDPNPVTRIQWTLAKPGGLGKVAMRASDDMVVHAGNHSGEYERCAAALTVGGLELHHFTWRTREQYLRKIRNGVEAYNATEGLPENLGVHWRMFESHDDETIMAHFDEWFYAESEVHKGQTLVCRPVPWVA